MWLSYYLLISSLYCSQVVYLDDLCLLDRKLHGGLVHASLIHVYDINSKKGHSDNQS